MSTKQLESLIYVSSAVRLLSHAEIEHLLERARERNLEYDITGVLLYIDGNFMQYLEGPKDNLDRIYQIICDDEMHSGIILISREPIEARQFDDWSMAFLTRDTLDFVDTEVAIEMIEKQLQLPAEDPSSARIVLYNFWTRNLR